MREFISDMVKKVVTGEAGGSSGETNALYVINQPAVSTQAAKELCLYP